MSNTVKVLCFAIVVIAFIGGRMLQIQWQADIYQKNFYKAEYEEYDWKFKQLEAQRDNLLSEHKRLRGYFE